MPTRTDVLVLGAGVAGHCAALAAADAGAKVLLLEKSGQPGGSSAIAGGAFAFVGTDMQIATGATDSLDAFRRDLLESGKHKNSIAMVDRFIASQLGAYGFLRAHGVKFDLHPGDSRIHLTGTGRAITTLHMAVRAHPNISFFSKSAAMRLHRSPASGRVDTVDVYFGDREMEITVDLGVVLATGGFSRSQELMQVYAPELANAVKHGGVGNMGDGILMASDLGAAHVDLGYVTGSFGGAIRNYPDVVHSANEVAPLLFSFLDGGILVNKHGKRFVNEGQSYKLLSNAGMKQPEGIGFQIFDQKLMDQSMGDSSVNNYKEGLIGGYIQQGDSIAAIATRMGIDPATLEATVAAYNAAVAQGTDAEFGREKTLVAIDTAPYYIAASANAITSTYGGLAVDGDLAVLNWFGETIEGLFAAGEVAGGFHGAGYYSASSLSSSATFGMWAGQTAARAKSVAEERHEALSLDG
jgi:fumarate reductase flavoprotein subunit